MKKKQRSFLDWRRELARQKREDKALDEDAEVRRTLNSVRGRAYVDELIKAAAERTAVLRVDAQVMSADAKTLFEKAENAQTLKLKDDADMIMATVGELEQSLVKLQGIALVVGDQAAEMQEKIQAARDVIRTGGAVNALNV